VEHDDAVGRYVVVLREAATAEPDSFMNIDGTARTTFGPPTRSRVSATRARAALCALNEARPPTARPASSSTVIAPTLCRLPA
jgi:hypothetical protein